MAKHPNETIKWKLKTLRNWIYDKWMRWRGFKPYGFDFYNNRNIYIKEEEFETEINEQEKNELEYEEVCYQCQPSNIWYRNKERDDTAKIIVANALMKGEDNVRIIRGPLPRS